MEHREETALLPESSPSPAWGLLGEGEIIFVGTGTSEGIPVASCLTKGFEGDHGNERGEGELGSPGQGCKVCFDAVRTDVRSPNRRRNTSLMVRWRRPPQESSGTSTSGGSFKRTHTNVLIDCGKFFWESALEWFPRHRVRYIDALLITHRHNDACYGLDDLRDWTKNINAAEGNLKPLEVHLREEDLQFLAKPFDYLIDTSLVTLGGGVAQLGWNVIKPYQPFDIEGLRITPLEIQHGTTPMFGFLFGEVAYLSDVNGIPERTHELIRGCGLLIIDMLRVQDKHPSHFILEETLDAIRLIKPKRALLVGLNHTVDHDSMNALLAELHAAEGINVQVAYDGQRLPVSLG